LPVYQSPKLKTGKPKGDLPPEKRRLSMQKWEYYTTFIETEMKQSDWEPQPMIPPGDHPKFSPYAAIPELNRLGEKGWEMLSMTPVIIGKNHDVLVHPNDMTRWSNTYFCVFKRQI
jgi:hypothetical protein